MRPALSWTLLSRDSIKRAEAQLKEDAQGVRDEGGSPPLHQEYADLLSPERWCCRRGCRLSTLDN